MRRLPVLTVVTALAAVLATAACGGGSKSDEQQGLVGSAPISATTLPTGTWTDQTGKPYTLAPGTATLVYFGYTSCPDVCPTVMADLAVALRAVKPAVADKVQVVMISSDPIRDTPAAFTKFLANYPAPRPFIGLSAAWSQISSTASSLGVPLSDAEPQTVEDVAHGARIYAFDAQGKSKESWLPSDHLQKDLEHDLPQLV